MEFLDAAIDKGWINVSTAKALKTATQKILSIEAGWEGLDLRGLDQDGFYERFCNLRRNDYSDDSMRIYKTRMGQAVRMYIAREDGDSAWKSYGPAGRPAANGNGGSSKKPRAKAASASAVDRDEDDDNGSTPPANTAPVVRVGLMTFPYPLRENLDVHLNLPRDLTKGEAERLCRFIATLARDEMLQLPAGSST
jgi:hypothetical protein